MQQAVGILRGVVLFNGALAAAAFVLAIFTLQRHNGARIAFTVAAAVLLFTAPLSGGGAADGGRRRRRCCCGRRPPATGSPAASRGRPAGGARAGRRASSAGAPLEPVAPSRPVTLPTEQPPQPHGPAAVGPRGVPVRPRARTSHTLAPPAPGYGYPPRPSPGGSGKRPATVTAAAWLTWASPRWSASSP